MVKEERFSKILKLLAKDGKVQYDTLSVHIGVSEDTIRRDIEALYKNGLLSKVRGGAIPVTKNPLSFTDRTGYFTNNKEIIALKALQFIHDGQTIFMDAGTTNCSIAAKLPVTIKLTIITNNIAIAPILAKHKNITLVLLGGNYNPTTQATEGAKACDEIKSYVADTYFLGTCAIDSNFGVTAIFLADADVKVAMKNNSKKIIALANEQKLNITESYSITPIENVSILITELASNNPKLDNYRDKVLKIV